ncbi:MAG TPA: SPASM domain-containing protein [Acidobacteriota bacterium]|nr:SPASM domain-containing protein [Acidobacteriota bacterium]HNR39672.1 SPASM domain-containing protein [Acidobacteriota bacterium]HNT99765.1 SPASM domain-containing protein [Acidobacteriota bacterium]HPB27510.1 SPASM domain-containing protein [Acidobacteriota bacterium]HQO24868.1 SPASM domain-containing protein [Acidobacteriota bacterium]
MNPSNRHDAQRADSGGQQIPRPEDSPRSLILDLTSRCNLRCFMCNAHMEGSAVDPASFRDMPDEVFARLQPLVARADTINLGGCGEPLFTGRILDRLAQIREWNRDAYLLTFTNGTCFSSRTQTERLLSFFNEVHISLNGVASYDRVMTGSHYPLIRRNLEFVRDARRAGGKPEILVIGFIVMRRNLDDIIPAAHLAKEMGFSRIQYKSLWVFNQELQTEAIHQDPDLTRLAREQVRAAHTVGIPVECEMWPELNTRVSGNWGANRVTQKLSPFRRRPPLVVRAGRMLRDDPRLFRERLIRFIGAYGRRFIGRPPRRDMSLPCHYPWRQVQVFENGDVFFCCEGETRIGNLLAEDFPAIWNSEEAWRYRDGLFSGHFYRDCARCKVIFRDHHEAYIKTGGNGQP